MPATALVVVGWVVSPIIKDLIGTVKTLLASKYRSFKDFRRRIDQLADVLEEIKTTVETVQTKHINDSDGLIRWVSRLMDAINEVEDILDAFTYDDILLSNLARKHKVSQVGKSMVKFLTRLFGRDKAFNRLKELLDELPRIQQSSRDLNQLPQATSSAEISATGQLVSAAEIFVGYKDEYAQLVSALVNEYVHRAAATASSSYGGNRNGQVVAVIGPGGSGKTTIARQARANLKAHFNLVIWASVSYKYTATELLAEIWRSIDGRPARSTAEMSFGILQEEVCALVKSKKYLLVLDDVCNDESEDNQMKKGKTWEDVLKPFQYGEEGSRILMTTRAKICSEILRAGTRIKLQGIDTGDLVLLLKKRAFGNEHEETPELDQVIASVAERLKGSPSAAAPVADKVRSNRTRKGWMEILELGYCNEITSVASANKSSYIILPQHLQSCLAFCSMFPDNWKFEPETLIKLWIAHGIISDNRSDGRSMEDIGKDYIRELLSRSFLKATKHGKTTHILIDEQIHLMLLSVCANYFFRKCHDTRGVVPPTVRHLSVSDGCLAQLNGDPLLKKLRTLLVFDGASAIDNDVLKQLESVRVLDLAGTSITDLPDGIGKLKHLRYLGLPSTVKSVPAGVTKLLHLQTLAGKDCKLVEFPAGCMNNLVNLRHLDIDMKHIASINGIGRLDKLQGSVEFRADRGQGHGMEELAGINSLHETLSVKGLHAVLNKEEALKAQLGKKEFLRVLMLEWETRSETFSTSSHEQVLEGLQPHGNKIRELHIIRYQGTSSPSWLGNNLLASLSHLYLVNCRKWQVLPSLSQLPDLKVLDIKGMHSVYQIDCRLYGSCAFRSLERLVLDEMPNLVEWTAESTDNVFPRLQEIHIVNCPKLVKLPRVPSSARNMKIENPNSYDLNLSFSSKSNSFTLDLRGDAAQLLQEDFLHQHHREGIRALSITQYTGTAEVQHVRILAFVQSLSLKSLELKGCHPMFMEKLRDKTTWANICSITRLNLE